MPLRVNLYFGNLRLLWLCHLIFSRKCLKIKILLFFLENTNFCFYHIFIIYFRTRSDPAIHTNTSATNPNLIDPNFLSYPFYSEVQNTWNNETPKMFNGPATAPPTAQIQPSVLFFPSYPLGQPNMPLNQTNSMFLKFKFLAKVNIDFD